MNLVHQILLKNLTMHGSDDLIPKKRIFATLTPPPSRVHI